MSRATNATRRDDWVHVFRLVNRSRRQTISQLKAFLVEKGLSDGTRATDRAFRLEFVRLVDGKERWSRRRFVGLTRADDKLRKLLRRGKEIHSRSRDRALA